MCVCVFMYVRCRCVWRQVWEVGWGRDADITIRRHRVESQEREREQGKSQTAAETESVWVLRRDLSVLNCGEENQRVCEFMCVCYEVCV